MGKPTRSIFIPMAVLLLALCVTLLVLHSPVVAAIAGGVSLLVLFVCMRVFVSYDRALKKEMDASVIDNASAAGRLIASVNVPCMVFHTDGRIIWRNAAMKKLYTGATIRDLPAACTPKTATQSLLMEYASGAYQVMNMPVVREQQSRPLMFQYWLDRTEAEHYSRLYEEQRPYVALIYVDNYEELSADLQFHRNTVLSEVERIISETATALYGTYRRYESGRFLLIFEAAYLKLLEKNKFDILERAHKIDTGTEQTVTLSIAVGAAARIAQSDTDARHAMELALGRGGDQAVVKSGANYAFYGGRRQLESGQSRVRARLFAKALRQLLENASEVYIMGHKQPDMDCLGAALGLVRCVLHVGSRPHIILDQVNPTIQNAIDEMRANPLYAGVLVSPETARAAIRSTSVLAVVDTQRVQSTIAPDLLPLASRLVLIDHHRRSADYIDNATLNYLESRSSSSCEMMTETLQYFHESVRPTAFECSALLAGITLDTKHFAFNVGARTFEAAAYLRQRGADIGAVKMMFQDDKDTYVNRVDTVKSAVTVYPGIAVATCAPDMKNAALIAAQAADALISIRGNEAAFVLSKQGDGVNISGRSLGNVNVQTILELLGGGGHLSMAGAQIEGVTLEEGAALLTRTIHESLEPIEHLPVQEVETEDDA